MMSRKDTDYNKYFLVYLDNNGQKSIRLTVVRKRKKCVRKFINCLFLLRTKLELKNIKYPF